MLFPTLCPDWFGISNIRSNPKGKIALMCILKYFQMYNLFVNWRIGGFGFF